MIRKLLAITSIAFVAGCATKPPPVTPAADPVRVSIEQALNKAADLPHHTMSADRPATPAVMKGDRITIRSYVGEASNLLGRLAKARGMTFKLNGPEPRLPLLVTVDVDSVTLEDLLSQVSFQFGQRADLVLGDGRIEIRYRGQP